MNESNIRRLQLPPRLQELLRKGEHTLEGHVRASISDFELWLAHNRLVFFPEYTDHGIAHVENVLAVVF